MPLILSGDTGISGVDGSAGTPSLQGTDSNTGVFYATDIVGISTNGSERMRVNSSGNVGIATNSPQARLDVISGADQRLLISTNSSSTAIVSVKADNSNYQALRVSGMDLLFATGGGDTERMRIDSSGNVGIGTNSPLGVLDVVKSGNQDTRIRSSTGGEANIRFQNTTTGTTSSDGLYVGIIGSDAYLYNYESANLILATSSAERMRIDSSGNVLIGQTSQVINEKLLVRDNAASSVNIRVRNDSTSASAGAAIGLNASGNTWGIECGSSAKNSNALTWLLDYGGTNQERLRLNTDGTLILRGGSTSATGTGITFPATQSASSDANTLDDYEEGTFTPSLAASGGSLSVTYGGNRSGAYTKIGNVVFIRIALRITSQSGGSGSYSITGLPFAASNPGDHLGVSTAAFENMPIGSTEQLINVIDNGGTSIRLLKAQNSSGWGDYTPGASGVTFFASFTYSV